MTTNAPADRMPVVRVGSVANSADAAELDVVLSEATMRSPSGFVVDLSSLDTIDCTTMSIVLRAYRSVIDSRGRLAVVTGHSLAVRAMATMLMKGLPSMHIVEDMDGALAAMLPHHCTMRRRVLAPRTVGGFAVAA